MAYLSTKTFGHELGLSCAFRQWRAQSHCRFIHGYALAFKFTFQTHTLDERNWVVDFGGLKGLKGILESNFDHKLIVAGDDPELPLFKEMNARGLAQVIVFPDGVGCEKIAEYVFEVAEGWLSDAGFAPRVKLVGVEVSEHGANSAVYTNPMMGLKL